MIRFVFAVLLFVYWEYITYADLSAEAWDAHFWVFLILLFLGVLGWAAVAVTRRGT